MQIDGQTNLAQLLKRYPWLLDEAKKLDRRFGYLDTLPGRLLLRNASVADLSRRAGLPEAEVLAKLREMLATHGA